MKILYEDNHLIAINKETGMLSQKDKTDDDSIIEWTKAYIKRKYNKPGDVYLALLHRIDRPVSGVVLFARTSKAADRMTKLFKERAVAKSYLAICTKWESEFEGSWESYLAKDHKKNRVTVKSKQDNDVKLAQTTYKWLASDGGYHLIGLKPKTGRSHQLRVQMASNGSPIYGDIKYRGDKIKDQSSIFLHAHEISFIHPVKKERVTITASPKAHMHWKILMGNNTGLNSYAS